MLFLSSAPLFSCSSSRDATHEKGKQWCWWIDEASTSSPASPGHSPDSWEPEVPGNHISLRGRGQRGIKERPTSVTELGGPPRPQTKHKQTATAGPREFRNTQSCIYKSLSHGSQPTFSLFSHIWAELRGHVRWFNHGTPLCTLNNKWPRCMCPVLF